MVRNPLKVECRCGCLGVREFHDAGARVRKAMLGRRLAAALKPVQAGKLSKRPGFGEKRAVVA